MYALPELLLVAAIMSVGSVVQGAIGFASGMIAVPMLVLSGLSLPEAATINLVSTSVQNLLGARKLWSHIEVREFVFPVVMRWIGIPIGVYCVWLANRHLSPSQAKQLIGVVLLVILLVLRFFHVQPRESINHAWQTLAFTASGFMMGFASIGGAPMVIYVNSLTWTAAKSRAFLFCCSASALPIAVTAFWLQHGESILPAALTALVVMPGILGGLWIGLRLGDHIPKPLFRRITYGLLFAIALSATILPLFFGTDAQVELAEPVGYK